MQERYIPSQPELTQRVQNPYARSMADGGGEFDEGMPPPPEEEAPPRPEETPEQKAQAEATQAWENYFRGRIPTADEERERAEAIAAGRFPRKISTHDVAEPQVVSQLRALNGLLSVLKDNETEDKYRILETNLQELAKLAPPPGAPREIREAFERSKNNAIEHILGQLKPLHARRLRENKEEMRRRSEERREHNLYGATELSEDEKETIVGNIVNDGDIDAVDELFNRMFRRVDDRPRDDWRDSFGSAGEYEFNEFLKTLQDAVSKKAYRDAEGRWVNITSVQVEKLRRKIKQYSDEKKMREEIHSANYSVAAGIGTEKLSEFAQFFQSELADVAFSKKGVTTAFHAFEQAILKVMAENDGYLPYDAMVAFPEQPTDANPAPIAGRVEFLARKYFKDALSKGLIKGAKIDPATGRPTLMDDWEINRAISVARGMGILTGRTIELAAQSKLPKDNRLVSLYAQDIIKTIAPFRHVVGKFEGGLERSRVFAYLLERGNAPWSKDELTKFSMDEWHDVINALTMDNKSRYLGQLNPFEIGGMFTRTGWRYGTDPMSTATGGILKDDKYSKRIGTGIWIELERGKLTSDKKLDAAEIQKIRDRYGVEVKTEAERAKLIIKDNLQAIARNQSLKIFFNLPQPERNKLQEQVFRRLGRNFENLQFKNDLDALVLVQEKAFFDKTDVTDDTFNVIDDAGQRARVKEIAGTISNVFLTGNSPSGQTFIDKLMTDLTKRGHKLPFNLGTDDLPFDEYDWSMTGGTSLARRWRDIMGAKKASDAVGELVKSMSSYVVTKPEQKDKYIEDLVEKVSAIYDGISEYDENVARKVTARIAEGVVKFYKKDWDHRLPFGLGTIKDIADRDGSFARAKYGPGAMAWDELDCEQFVRELKERGRITEEGEHHLKRRVGAGGKEMAYALGRNIGSLLAVAYLLYLLTKSAQGK